MKIKNVIVSTLLTFAIGLNGCSATGSYGSFKSDQKILVGDVARKAFQYEGIERRPVIVIPGIFGSRLVDSVSGGTVWGEFTGKETLANFAIKQLRLLSLPIENNPQLAGLKDTVVPDGVLETIQARVLGVHVHINAYKDMIDALEFGGYYGADSKGGEGRKYDTSFTFGYDWRKDLPGTAKKLHAFIQEKKRYLQLKYEELYGVKDYDVKFDIIAHSMGGLITRYYLLYGDADLPADGSAPAVTWKGAKNIAKAVIVGTPNAGYLDAFTELVEGMIFAPGVPKIEPALLGTWSTLYQMMPAVAPGMVMDDKGGKFDIFNPDLWIRMKWGLADPGQSKMLEKLFPDIKSPEARREAALTHLRERLDRARQFTNAVGVDAVPPAGLSLHLFVGESILTNAQASVDVETGRVTVVKQLPGDGKVSAVSAIFNKNIGNKKGGPFVQSPIHWSSVTFLFAAHMGITRDPVFISNMLYILLLDRTQDSAVHSAA